MSRFADETTLARRLLFLLNCHFTCLVYQLGLTKKWCEFSVLSCVENISVVNCIINSCCLSFVRLFTTTSRLLILIWPQEPGRLHSFHLN